MHQAKAQGQLLPVLGGATTARPESDEAEKDQLFGPFFFRGKKMGQLK
jgi:hypothetical protein